MRTRNQGFTLVEILIVVIILGILAAIVIPQFTDASTSAKQSSLDSNIQTLMSQFELYKVQHNDIYPWSDGAGGVAAAGVIEGLLIAKTNAAGTTDVADGPLNFGPYFQKVPANPFCANATPVFAAAGAADGTVDWVIDVATGALSSGHTDHPASGD